MTNRAIPEPDGGGYWCPFMDTMFMGGEPFCGLIGCDEWPYLHGYPCNADWQNCSRVKGATSEDIKS